MRAHGTHVRYVQGPDEHDQPGGCRCEPCRAANCAYERERKQRTEPAYVIAGPARAHLAWLAAQGVGLKSVSIISGLSHGTLSKLVYGDGTRGSAPSKRIRHATADKILAVTPSDAPGGTRVPAQPVLDMVDRLVTAGVPKVRIAERIGQTGPGLQLGETFVTRRHAQAIRAMVAELDAGTLVTVKRHRNGDRTIAPPAAIPVAAPVDHDDRDAVLLELVELLEARIDENNWRKDSACRGRPPWLFFPARGDVATIRMAKKVCAACIVRDQCLATNLLAREGIYGGTTPRQRRAIRSERMLLEQAS